MIDFQFLTDPRLKRWYVQNYDLVGCNRLSNVCSDVKKAEEAVFATKVFPIPIGLDLHTFAGKGDMESSLFQEKACSQRQLIDSLRRNSIPLHKRDLSIVVAFDCSKKQEVKSVRRFALRRELCGLIEGRKGSGRNFYGNKRKFDSGGALSALSSLLNLPFASPLASRFSDSLNNTTTTTTTTTSNKNNIDYLSANINGKGESDTVQLHSIVGEGEKSREAFWRQVSTNSSFAFAPFGRGLDTHRVWEILMMGGIPIVLTSSLDRLYSEFPILILKSWSQAFSQSFLRMKRDDIISRFGSQFNAEVLDKLTLDHWVKRIRDGK